MASSSVHFKKATSHSSAHNTRADIPKYLLPEEHRLENEYWQNEKSARQLFDDELQKATRKGGPKPKFENSHWEAVLNLNAEHSLADVQKVVKLIEKKFNITCTSIAVHRDEGHVKEGQPIYNYHAHLEFMTYQNGQQNWRREHVKNGLSELQTIVANELKMTRGKSGAVRLEHREYKAKEQEKELVLEKEREKSAYNFRDFQQQITALSTENTDLKKELHKLNTQVSKGNATVQELEEKIAALSKQLEHREKALTEILPTAQKPIEVVQYVQELEKDLSEALQSKNKLSEVNHTQNSVIVNFRATQSVLNAQIQELKTENENLKNENEKLTWYKKQYKAIVSSLKKFTKLDDIRAVMQSIKEKFQEPNVFQTIQTKADTNEQDYQKHFRAWCNSTNFLTKEKLLEKLNTSPNQSLLKVVLITHEVPAVLSQDPEKFKQRLEEQVQAENEHISEITSRIQKENAEFKQMFSQVKQKGRPELSR
ncbi:MAG: hypothetical protein EOM53_05680 [Alphaproteobacteria bacterium]|nr:hypothetical protein [Alphaproteobacteria bacterium]